MIIIENNHTKKKYLKNKFFQNKNLLLKKENV